MIKFEESTLEEYKKIPEPSDIVEFIKAYYNILSINNEKDPTRVASQKTIGYLDDLIETYPKDSPERAYLILYNQIASDIAKSKSNLDSKYEVRLAKLKKAEDTVVNDIKNKIKGIKAGVERWFSIGIGSLFSYFASNFLVEYLNIPGEYVQDAVAAMTFGLIGLISVGVHKYYSHESVKVLEKFNKKIDRLEEKRTRNTRNLYKRGEVLAQNDYETHIEGIQSKKTVDKVSKEDGTKDNVIKSTLRLLHIIQ